MVPGAHFDTLAEDDAVNRELSDKANPAALEHPDLAKQFLRAAQFLRSLLASGDERLLRP